MQHRLDPMEYADRRKHAKTFDGTDGRPEKEYTSQANQADRDGTRVDSILKKYATRGVDSRDIGLFQQHTAQMTFGVQDMEKDYQTQLNKINQVQDYFKNLPSRIREKFGNSPANMLKFMADPKNLETCQDLGLFAKPADVPGSGREPEKTPPNPQAAEMAAKTGQPKT